MATIIRGTTPSIHYNFTSVNVSDITVAVLTIKQGDSVIIEKQLTDAVVDTDSITWTLAQADTLLISVGKAEIMLNWKTTDGLRGASKKDALIIESNHINEVI